MKYSLLLTLAVLPYLCFSQKFQASLFGGVANYQGDLQGKRLSFKESHPAIGIGASYDLTSHFILRTGFSYGRVSGSDKNNSSAKGVEFRNLDFRSDIWEFHLGADYNIFDLSERSLSPYVFAGVGLYHFDPFTRDAAGNKVFLQRLGTEGQGMAGYPSKYKTTQFNIPFGVGLKFALTENIQLGFEIGLRKLFTDQLDDVSGNYADSTLLADGNGSLAAQLAYRGDELAGSPGYPTASTQRGNSKYKDWYNFTGLKVSYRIGGRKSKDTGCPSAVY